MKKEVTPERVMELGEEWSKLLLRHMNAQERLAGISPEEVLTRLPLEEIEAWLAKQRVEQAKTTTHKTKPGPARNNYMQRRHKVTLFQV